MKKQQLILCENIYNAIKSKLIIKSRLCGDVEQLDTSIQSDLFCILCCLVWHDDAAHAPCICDDFNCSFNLGGMQNDGARPCFFFLNLLGVIDFCLALEDLRVIGLLE